MKLAMLQSITSLVIAAIVAAGMMATACGQQVPRAAAVDSRAIVLTAADFPHAVNVLSYDPIKLPSRPDDYLWLPMSSKPLPRPQVQYFDNGLVTEHLSPITMSGKSGLQYGAKSAVLSFSAVEAARETFDLLAQPEGPFAMDLDYSQGERQLLPTSRHPGDQFMALDRENTQAAIDPPRTRWISHRVVARKNAVVVMVSGNEPQDLAYFVTLIERMLSRVP